MSFDEFYAQTFPRLVGFVSLTSKGQVDPEAVAQEALARAYLRWAKLTHPRSYVYQSAINACKDASRRQHLWNRAARLLHTPESQADPDPHQFLDALRTLPTERRIVVVLRYYADMTVPEIARVTAQPIGTVKSRLSRGLAELKEILADDN